MKILAVETSTEACSAALFVDGRIYEQFEIAPREHTRLILPMIDSLLSGAQLRIADLDGLAFGCGPGSFTGVRIATGVIHGIALGGELPLIPVSTLAAMAHECFERTEHEHSFVAMDARMDEVYWGAYRRCPDNSVELIGEESVGPACQVSIPNETGYGVGSGWEVYQQDLEQRLGSRLAGFDAGYLPKASSVVSIAAQRFEKGYSVPVELAAPVYLRDKIVKDR